MLHGIEAQVRWYAGGDDLVSLPTAVAALVPGVYMVKPKFFPVKSTDDDDYGPHTPVASISQLRWLDTMSEFDRRVMVLGRFSAFLDQEKYQRLRTMLGDYDLDEGNSLAVNQDSQSSFHIDPSA